MPDARLPKSSSAVVHIARCPEHGLHGERTECFVCGGEVEQVPMVPAEGTDEMVERAARELHERVCSPAKPWDELADFHRTTHRDDAREVLGAAFSTSHDQEADRA